MTPSDRYSPEQQRMVSAAQRRARQSGVPAPEPPTPMRFWGEVVAVAFLLLVFWVVLALLGAASLESGR